MLKTIRDDCNYSPSPQGGVSLIVFERVWWSVLPLRSGFSWLIAIPIWRNLGKQSFTCRWTSVLYLYSSWTGAPQYCTTKLNLQVNLIIVLVQYLFVSDIVYIICRMNGSDRNDLCIPSFLQERRRAFSGMKRSLENRFIEPVQTRCFIIRQDWIRDSEQECSTVQSYSLRKVIPKVLSFVL